MTRKRCYLISAAVLVACVGIALGVMAILPPQPGATKANFDKIEEGMAEADVKAILGEPDVRLDGPAGSFFQWIHADGADIIVTTVDSKVAEKQFNPSTETISRKIRRWLHLPKAAAAPAGFGRPPPPKFP